MKKGLLFGGIAIAGFGLYRYFKYQIDLALNYDYKLKDFKIISQVGDIMKVSAVFQITNKSSFKVDITGYDLKLFFKDVQFAQTILTEKTTIQPNSSFEIIGYGDIDIKKTKILVLPLINDILKKKPINVSVSGMISVVFLGIPTTLKFDRKKINYSVDLLKEYNLSSSYEKLKSKYPKVFSLLGVA
jgi:LEA14-like dessication related protein